MVFNWFLPHRDEYLSQFERREDRRLYVNDIFQQLTEVRKAKWSFLYKCIKNFDTQHSKRHSSLLLLLQGGIMEEYDDVRRDIAEKVRSGVVLLLMTDYS